MGWMTRLASSVAGIALLASASGAAAVALGEVPVPGARAVPRGCVIPAGLAGPIAACGIIALHAKVHRVNM